MSSARLKRKLDDYAYTSPETPGLNAKSLTESFVEYGTPLPSLTDTKKDKGEFVPLWKQEVRDEKGRQRLHGAFTGGFSAGYFNSVGSKEGWQPAQFVSSRTAKAPEATRQRQRPEDFMDEEDLADLRASQTIQTSEPFSDVTGPSLNEQDGKALGALKELIEPSKERIGKKIMVKMGWREGQGVGPRISAEKRRRQDLEFGVAGGMEEGENEGVDEEANKHLFAPRDRPLLVYEMKDDTKGLGWAKGQTLDEILRSQERLPRKEEGQAESRDAVRSGHFGISALEDADEDDTYDIYDQRAPSTNPKARMIHDFDDENEASSEVPDQRSKAIRSLRPKSRPVTRHSSDTTSPFKPSASRPPLAETFNSGATVLKGFRLATKAQAAEKWFSPPAPPKEWKPNPQKIWEIACRQVDVETEAVRGEREMMTADQRAKLLNDTPSAPPSDGKKSVFDYISSANRERLESFINAAKASSKPSAASVTGGQPAEPRTPTVLGPSRAPVTIQVPRLERATALAALKGYIPFAEDLPKRARYKLFLESMAGLRGESIYSPRPERNMTVENLNKELEEFKRSAEMFKPSANMMASRFTTGSDATAVLDDKKPVPGLRQPVFEPESEKKEESKEAAADSSAKAKNESPASHAARLGMFGPLTRTTKSFYPVRLLCKRFNVPDPHPEGPQADGDDREILNKGRMEEIMKQSGFTSFVSSSDSEASNKEEEDLSAPTTPAAPDKPTPAGSVGLGEDEGQGKDTLTYVRPPMDIFKAIFADEDEDSDEDDDDAVKEVVSAQTSKPLDVPTQDPFPPRSTASPSIAVPVAVEESSAADGSTPFRPTFVSKSARTSLSGKAELTPSSTGKTKKKKDKKRSSNALVSFDAEFGLADDDEVHKDGEGGAVDKIKKRRSKDEEGHRKEKRRKQEGKGDDGSKELDDMVWVEAEPVKNPSVAPALAPAVTPAPALAGKKERMRASDFL